METRSASRRGHDTKARYILGLSTDHDSTRSNTSSPCSTSTRRVHSVKFSDHATVLGSGDGGRRTSVKNDQGKQDNNVSGLRRLRSFASNNSLSSLYEKKSVSPSARQRTPTQSGRDSRLRRRTPMTASSFIDPGTQRSQHFRLFSRADKAETTTSASLRSTSASLYATHDQNNDNEVEVTESLLPSASASRISITRPKSQSHLHTKVVDPPPMAFALPVRGEVDPRAKINVRRPKAGTKDWFDDVDVESSEEETDQTFKTRHTAVAQRDDVSTNNPLQVVSSDNSWQSNGAEVYETEETLVPKHHEMKTIGEAVRTRKPRNGRKSTVNKVNPFAMHDLSQFSVLSLSSSEDEDDQPTTPLSPDLQASKIGLGMNLLEEMMYEPNVELDQALDGQKTDHYPHTILGSRRIGTQTSGTTASRRDAHDMSDLYLDHSDEISDDDLLSAFPRTPSDTRSRRASYRNSILSDSGSIASTRLVPLTRQEESLIAAMRMKKAAMKRTQALARQNIDGLVHNMGSFSSSLPRNSRQLSRNRRSDIAISPCSDTMLPLRYPESYEGRGAMSYTSTQGRLDDLRERGSISTAMTDDPTPATQGTI